MLRELPSERYLPGSLVPVGFVENPDSTQIERSAEALQALGREVSDGAPSGRLLRVTFSHFRQNHLLSPKLFGFGVYGFDSEGNWIDPISVGEPVRYAVTLNLPVELQRESALVFLYQLVLRQATLASGAPDVASLHQLVSATDRDAVHVVADALRYGWIHAARTIADQAAANGLSLEVDYLPDPVPSRAELVSRAHVLARAYNEDDQLRLAIDRVVAVIGSEGPRVASTGGSEGTRQWLQSQSQTMYWREYMNQAVRDSLILGNGYVAFTTEPTPATYCLRPQEVLKGEPDVYSTVNAGSVEPVADHVLHLLGIEQSASQYGISTLEPIVSSFVNLETVIEAADSASDLVVASASVDAARWEQTLQELRDRTARAFSSTVENLFFLPLQHWTSEPRDLYFPGQELIR